MRLQNPIFTVSIKWVVRPEGHIVTIFIIYSYCWFHPVALSFWILFGVQVAADRHLIWRTCNTQGRFNIMTIKRKIAKDWKTPRSQGLTVEQVCGGGVTYLVKNFYQIFKILYILDNNSWFVNIEITFFTSSSTRTSLLSSESIRNDPVLEYHWRQTIYFRLYCLKSS